VVGSVGSDGQFEVDHIRILKADNGGHQCIILYPQEEQFTGNKLKQYNVVLLHARQES
jgi:hypothetical protein